jgi:murein DD-endopeptidase MepM/ murein hydrolase activator NlpD
MGAFILSALLAASLFLPADTQAKKIYKFKDENGVWNFSDSPPETKQPVEVEQVSIRHNKRKVSILKRGKNEQPVIYIVNDYHGPVEVEVSLAEHENISTDPELPFRVVIPALKEVKAFTVTPVDPDKKWSYKLKTRFYMGEPGVEHNPPVPYQPPFAPGTRFRISQGFHGKYSHNRPGSLYAVDIGMPEGTPIYSARGGIIMDVTNDFFRGGENKDKFVDRANIIRILHDDGTIGVYAHLKLETARFPPGKRVGPGQFIAESGNTGFSSGPHLHFVVQKNAGLKTVSVPFEFQNVDGTIIVPKRGEILSTSFKKRKKKKKRK